MYREHAPPSGLEAVALCSWEQRSERTRVVRIVPDAAMDLLWNGRELLVAGPDTQPFEVRAHAGATTVGLRFRTGVGSARLGVSARAVCDCRIPLVTFWGDYARRLCDALSRVPPERARALLEGAVATRMPVALTDPLIPRLMAELEPRRERPVLKLAVLSRRLGLSERQLLRRCEAAVGYGPKLLARIVRLRAFERRLRAAPSAPLVELAAELGYADQAHLTHDAAELFGTTPGKMRAALAVDSVGKMSDFDKTARRAAGHVPSHAHSHL